MEANDQVRIKKQLRNGTQILYGTIISFTDESRTVANVSVSQDTRKPRMIQASSRIQVPVSKLESVKNLFGGRAVVQSNPTHRNLSSLISQLNNSIKRRNKCQLQLHF